MFFADDEGQRELHSLPLSLSLSPLPGGPTGRRLPEAPLRGRLLRRPQHVPG